MLAAGCGSGAYVAASMPAPVSAAPATQAPDHSFPVGIRLVSLARGPGRPLPTTIWYPAATGTAGAPPRAGLPVAAGRFPLVLFSHGLSSLPELHAEMIRRWAGAGFVVAAPAYPHTNRRTASFSRADVRNQPADARQVIREVGLLDTRPDDPLAGHLDASRVVAAGHSAGGYTTAGLFTADHSPALRGGIVMAGGMRQVFGGSPAPLLFIHGDRDPTVPVRTGRAAFDRVRWPKAFLTVSGQGHAGYLVPGRSGFAETMATTTDFLRWRLYGDEGARRRLPADAGQRGAATLDDRL
ncbi:alpha/beta hydrolase family protein [Plantactinospora siamensis]